MDERVAGIREPTSDLAAWKLSGSICGWGDELRSEMRLAVLLELDPSVRLAILRAREVGRYGLRIAPGGDMYEQHLEFLAGSEGVHAAVLGLFGCQPPPATPVMNRCAPDVIYPVYFIQKLDDGIHPAQTTSALFSILGSVEKVLDSTHGLNVKAPTECFDRVCRFLVEKFQLI